MNGAPVVHALCFVLCYILLVYPIYLVTGKHSSLTVPVETEMINDPVDLDQQKPSALLLIQSAHPWVSLYVTINDQEAISFDQFTSNAEVVVRYEEPCHLLIDVTWSEETPETALRVEMHPDRLETKYHTAWGTQAMREEITFTWND